MKRSIACLLAAVMVLTLIPMASAAAPGMPKLEERTAEVLSLTSAPDRYQTTADDVLYAPSWIEPRFETYGLSAVVGETMRLAYYESVASVGDMYEGIMIYEGTYESLTDTSEPVAVFADTAYTGYRYENWDTAGMEPGDYTALFCLLDQNFNMVFASAADLYLSETEIPLEALEIYAYQFDGWPEQVDLPQYANVAYGIDRYPYHATVATEEFSHVRSGMSEGRVRSSYGGNGVAWGVRPEATGYLEVRYTNDGGTVISDRIDFTFVEEKTSYLRFESTDVDLCYGVPGEIAVTIPEEVTEILVHNANSHIVEVVEVDREKIVLQVLAKGAATISMVCGNDIDTVTVETYTHNYIPYRQAPTCTADGKVYGVCQDCGHEKVEQVLPALGHEVAESVVVTEPRATKDGVAIAHCSRCELDVELAVPRIFTDTEPDWFYSDPLDYCYENGIINGLTADTFGPTATLNRAQLVTMLYRHAGSPAVEEGSAFTDVPEGQFYSAPVAWASANGIVNGYEDGSFQPAAPITREQIVTMLHRYVTMLGRDNGERNDLSAFEDLDMLHGYALEPMQWAVANGVINGMSETVLGPQQSANRAQTVTILYRIITGILADA